MTRNLGYYPSGEQQSLEDHYTIRNHTELIHVLPGVRLLISVENIGNEQKRFQGKVGKYRELKDATWIKKGDRNGVYAVI